MKHVSIDSLVLDMIQSVYGALVGVVLETQLTGLGALGRCSRKTTQANVQTHAVNCCIHCMCMWGPFSYRQKTQ